MNTDFKSLSYKELIDMIIEKYGPDLKKADGKDPAVQEWLDRVKTASA